ncbi:MAG: type II toxin-antitoxin system HicA family toxin [Deltaproteobacteria bacterium]|nr:type II toxin-antitoxin system HicA family toxin [Deltaproteobacteria bacterium]
MKRNKLLKELKKYGWILIRQGGRHEIWGNGMGCQEPVGRHPDIPEELAKKIIRTAKQNPGK